MHATQDDRAITSARARFLRPLLGAAMLAGLAAPARALDLAEPAVFRSSNGVLDLVVTTKAKPIGELSFLGAGGSILNPTGWVYEVCYRTGGASACPEGSAAPYGGVRLALQKGDALKIRLVNRLPTIDPTRLLYADDILPLNPTNLHTHGVLTPARAPTVSDPTFGDYVFVSLFNPSNGAPKPASAHRHGSFATTALDYRIDIPVGHPPGVFWLHPHIHGLTLNQVSAGLSAIITIGAVGDYVKGDLQPIPVPEANVRNLVIKDLQVLSSNTQLIQPDASLLPVADGEVLHQQDGLFCSQRPAPGEDRRGVCPGVDRRPGDAGPNFSGGAWYFTLNGRQYPTIRVTNPDGEVWRLTNASGNMSYLLELARTSDGAPLPVQLTAVDGVPLQIPVDGPADAAVKLAGTRFRFVDCPNVALWTFRSRPACTDRILLMPGQRVEFWTTWRGADGAVATAPGGAAAVLRSLGVTMGTGDRWPAVELAEVRFEQTGARRFSNAALDLYESPPTINSLFAAAGPAPRSSAVAPIRLAGGSSSGLQPECAPLPAGHRRRIFFGLENVLDGASFGLGYEELDASGAAIPGTQRPVKQFDDTAAPLCLPLGPGQSPVRETWELVQLATENHNFHLHQARFSIVPDPAAAAPRPGLPLTAASSTASGWSATSSDAATQPARGVMQDTTPLGVSSPTSFTVNKRQNGVCTIDQWRSGECPSKPIVVEVQFTQPGEFVYHCHMLEHEDGGMMSRIKVAPSPY